MTWKTLMDGDTLLKVRKAGKTGYWWVLQSTDLVSCCGETEAAEISGSKRMLILGELTLVPGKILVSDKQIKSVVETYGWSDKEHWEATSSDFGHDNELCWVEMANGYGLKVLVNTACGATNESALRKTLKEACVDLDGPVDHHLDKTVNRLGQTGREHLADDMDSALNRAACIDEASDEQRLMAKISNTRMRQVRQSNLSAECMLIQVWGPSSCDTCEVRGTPQCGGQNIRKTGKNENGLEVPVS